MKNEKQTSNLNFNVQLFWKSENHLFWCFLSQLQYRKENQNFISNFIFQFIKNKNKTKWHFGYPDSSRLSMLEEASENDFALIVNLQTYKGLPKVPIHKNEPRFQDWPSTEEVVLQHIRDKMLLYNISPRCLILRKAAADLSDYSWSVNTTGRVHPSWTILLKVSRASKEFKDCGCGKLVALMKHVLSCKDLWWWCQGVNKN